MASPPAPAVRVPIAFEFAKREPLFVPGPPSPPPVLCLHRRSPTPAFRPQLAPAAVPKSSTRPSGESSDSSDDEPTRPFLLARKKDMELDAKPDVKPNITAYLVPKAAPKRKRKAKTAPDLDPDAPLQPKAERRKGAPLPRLPQSSPTWPLPLQHAPATTADADALVADRVRAALSRATPRGTAPLSWYLANKSQAAFTNADIPGQVERDDWCCPKGEDAACTSVRIGEEEAVPLALTLSDILHAYFGSTHAAALLREADDATHAWCQARPPHVPSGNSRFAHLPHAALKAHHEPAGESYGVLHFADWLEQGHPGKGVQSAADLNTDRNWKTRAKMRWFRGLRGLWPVVARALRALDGECYERYKRAAAKLEEDSYLQLNLKTPDWLFSGLALNVNMAAGVHKDWQDCPDGWVCMLAFGEFSGGAVVLPSLARRIPMPPGTLVFIRARLLEHYIEEFTGHRYGMVCFFHEGVLEVAEGM